MRLRVYFFSPHILALPEEACEDMLEMKSDQVFGEKAAQDHIVHFQFWGLSHLDLTTYSSMNCRRSLKPCFSAMVFG